MKKVKCISERKIVNSLVIGNYYYMDERTIYTDDYGYTYAQFYADEKKEKYIGNLSLLHFCMIEDDNCVVCDTCNN